MSHRDLGNYYKSLFALKIHHNFDMEWMENLIPFEFEIYSVLLMNHVKQENERIQQGKNG